jgi:protein involved in polysaccharide export with SLBB domain/beta-lactamase regulating signal transducer with metallopeptidase domain
MTALLKFYPGDVMLLLTANVLVQLAVVVALAWIISMGFARHRAAVRYAVWLSALGCMLVSPMAAYLAARSGLSLISLPILPQPVLAELNVSPRTIPAVANAERSPDVSRDQLPPPPMREAAGGGMDGEAAKSRLSHASQRPNFLPKQERTSPARSPRETGSSASEPKDSLRALLGLVAVLWAVGVVFSLARVWHGLRSIARLRQRLEPVDGDRLHAILSEIRRTMHTTTLPRVAIGPPEIELAGPITIGVFRPLVILPERLLKTLEPGGLRDVLIHEFAHALRHDPLVGCLQRLAAILYWPYPPVHFLNRKLAWAREELCDDYVLRQGDAASYAETLLAVSQTLSGHMQPAALGLFHPRGRLERRVAGLLDERRTVMVQVHRVTMVALAGLFIAAIVVVAGTRLSGADATEKSPLPAAPTEQHASPTKPATVTAKTTPQINRIEPFDVLQIRVMGTIMDRPIDGFFLVALDGRVGLGPSYGRVNVKGLTPVQAEDKITQALKKVLAKPLVQVMMARKTPSPPLIPTPYRVQPLDVLQVSVVGTGPLLMQPIDGLYLVEPDGKVPLGPRWGRVDVNGLTVDQAEEKIKHYLAKLLPESPAVQVQWARRGSKWREVVFPNVPYTISPDDWLSVHVMGTMVDQPIDGSYVVEPTGTIGLGPAYGRAAVEGLTLGAAEQAIHKQLEKVVSKPTVQVTLSPFVSTGASMQIPGAGHWKDVSPPKTTYTIKPGDVLFVDALGTRNDPPLADVYLVEPAGSVALGPAYGRAQVEGLTLEAAENAIQKKLKEVLPNPVVQVTLAGWEGAETMLVQPRHRVARESRQPRSLTRGGGTSKTPASAAPAGEPSAPSNRFQQWLWGQHFTVPPDIRREAAGMRNAQLSLAKDRVKLQEAELELSHRMAFAVRNWETSSDAVDQLLAHLTDIRFGVGPATRTDVQLVRFYPALGREALAAVERLHWRVVEDSPAVLTVGLTTDKTSASAGMALQVELKYTSRAGKQLTLWKGKKQIVADLSAIISTNEQHYKAVVAKEAASLLRQLVDAVLQSRAHAQPK